LKNHNMVEGMNIDASTSPSAQCKTCIRAKSHVAPFPAEAERKFTGIGEMTFTDVWGPSRVTGIRGERYYISFTDGAKCRAMVYPMKKRTKVLDKIKHYVAFIYMQTGEHVQVIHCDNAQEYISKDTRSYLASRGIRLELTAPYSPEQNSVAERLNRTLIEHARPMLAAHDVPHFLWPEAVAYAAYLKNRSPTRALGTTITPDEAFWGRKPNVAALQEFGASCEVLQQGGDRSKLCSKTRSCIFVGLSDESRAWRQ
jgi:transposase InsO family protein